MSGSAATQGNPPIRLLPTDPEAARVRVLQNAFDNHPAGDARARDYAELKTIVRDFVVRQLNAAPAISDETIREQLRKVVGRFWAERADGGLYVKSDASWGPRSKQRVWAIAYVVWLGTHGPGGTAVVVDCYVWEDGQTRFAERRDSDFSGYSLYVDWLATLLKSACLRTAACQAATDSERGRRSCIFATYKECVAHSCVNDGASPAQMFVTFVAAKGGPLSSPVRSGRR
jgi:hypothetical protein